MKKLTITLLLRHWLAAGVVAFFCCGQGAEAAAQQASDLQVASSLLLEKRYADAVALLQKIMPSHQDQPEAHVMLAYALFRENKPAESLKEYTVAAQLHKPTAEDLKWVAQDYVLLNDYKDAAKWMALSLSMDEGDEEAWYSLGRIDYTLSHYTEAEYCFDRALKLDPHDVKAENNLGLTYESLYRPDEAMAAYRKAIEWQQDAPHLSEEPYLNLAIVLLNQNKVDEAFALLKKAEAIAPENPQVLTQLARVDLEQNRFAEAESELKQAVKAKPNDASLHFQLGRVLRRENKTDEAKAEFARAAALDGTHSTPDH